MQVNIKYVNFPKVGSTGKYGSIVDQNGTKIMVPIDLLNLFRAGMVVDVPTKQQTWGNDLMTIATNGPGGAPTGAVQQGYAQQGYQGGVSQETVQRANTGFQPRVVQGGLAQPAQPDQARHIYITGIVGRAMGSGKFAASEIPVLTKIAIEAYDLLNQPPKPVAPARTELPADDVPWPEQGDPGPLEPR